MAVRSRVVAFGGLLAATSLVAFLSWSCVAARHESTDVEPSPSKRAEPDPVVKPGYALEQLRAHFRPQPDRRFQAAIADLFRLSTGAEPKAVTARWTDNRWDLLHGDQLVARVSPLPQWTELFGSLVEWAVRLRAGAARQSESSEVLEELPRAAWGNGAHEGLAALDRAWTGGAHTARLANHAARLMGLAHLEANDEMQLSDPLAARALAALALGRSLDQGAGREEEALLAWTLGYSVHAVSIATDLPEASAIAAYVLDRHDRLENLAPAGEEARYLRLARLAARSSEEWRAEASEWKAEGDALASVLSSGLENLSFEHSRWLPQMLLALLTSHWTGEPIPEGETAMKWMLSSAPAVERAIQNRAATLGGPFHDATSFAAAAEARYFNALRETLVFPLASMGAPDSARELLALYPAPGTGRVESLRKWYEALLSYYDRRPLSLEQRWEAVHLASSMGVNQRLSLLGAIRTPAVNVKESGERKLLLAFLDTLDSRPQNRKVASPYVRSNLRNVPASLWLDRSIVRDDRFRSLQATSELQQREGDFDALWVEVLSPDYSPSHRANTLHTLVTGEKADPIRGGYACDELWKESALRRGIASTCAWLFDSKLEQPERALRLLEAFIEDPASEEGLHRPKALAQIAQILLRTGRPELAWEIVEPRLEGEVGEIFSAGIDSLLALGRAEEAEMLCRKAIARYPNGYTTSLAGVLWAQGRHREAASEIESLTQGLLNVQTAEHVFFLVSTIFKDRPEELYKAFDELARAAQARNRTGGLSYLAGRFEGLENYETAFEMYWRLARLNPKIRKDSKAEPLYETPERSYQKDQWRIQDLTFAWRTLRSWKGEAEANRWFLERMPQGVPPVWAGYFHPLPELLWAAYPEPDPSPYVWKQRAIEASVQPYLMERYGAQLVEHFTPERPIADHEYGRIALGLTPESDVLSTPLRPRDLMMVAFYLGVSAERQGDKARASDWYQVSQSAGVHNEPEYNFGQQRLSALVDQPFVGYAPHDLPVDRLAEGHR
jgi:hypothetical protein